MNIDKTPEAELTHALASDKPTVMPLTETEQSEINGGRSSSAALPPNCRRMPGISMLACSNPIRRP